jgi:hypothetical protein
MANKANSIEKQPKYICSGLLPIGFYPNRPDSIHGGFLECKEFVKNSESELEDCVKPVGSPRKTFLTNADCIGIMWVRWSVERETLHLRGRTA